MAPPKNRRTGFSKRAQYNVFYAYLAGFAGAIVGAAFLLYSWAHPDSLSGLRGLASDAVAPAGRAVAAGRSGTIGVADAIGGFFTSGAHNARLQKEAELARVRLAEADDLRAENQRLKALLGIPEANEKPVANARLIASTPGSARRFATLSVGRNAGVITGMPVRTPLGLVGRVLDVSATTARVMLVTDSESMVPVRRAKDGISAFARGLGDGTLQLGLNNLGPNPLKPGDVFVTSGQGGLFRPGIAVAVVMEPNRDGAVARVLSDPATSDYVMVDRPWSASLAMPEPAPPPPPVQPGKK